MCRILRKVDVRLPGKGNLNSHRARPVHLFITMIKRTRTSRLSTNNFLSLCRIRPTVCSTSRGCARHPTPHTPHHTPHTLLPQPYTQNRWRHAAVFDTHARPWDVYEGTSTAITSVYKPCATHTSRMRAVTSAVFDTHARPWDVHTGYERPSRPYTTRVRRTPRRCALSRWRPAPAFDTYWTCIQDINGRHFCIQHITSVYNTCATHTSWMRAVTIATCRCVRHTRTSVGRAYRI